MNFKGSSPFLFPMCLFFPRPGLIYFPMLGRSRAVVQHEQHREIRIAAMGLSNRKSEEETKPQDDQTNQWLERGSKVKMNSGSIDGIGSPQIAAQEAATILDLNGGGTARAEATPGGRGKNARSRWRRQTVVVVLGGTVQ